MFGFLKKLFGFGKQEDCSCCGGKDEDPIVKLGPEPTPEPVGVIAQEVAKVIPEAVAVEQRPEVVVSAQAAWPFPTKMPEQGKGKKKPATKKKPASTKKAEPAKKQPAPAPAKKKPAAMTPAPKKKKKPAAK